MKNVLLMIIFVIYFFQIVSFYLNVIDKDFDSKKQALLSLIPFYFVFVLIGCFIKNFKKLK